MDIQPGPALRVDKRDLLRQCDVGAALCRRQLDHPLRELIADVGQEGREAVKIFGPDQQVDVDTAPQGSIIISVLPENRSFKDNEWEIVLFKGVQNSSQLTNQGKISSRRSVHNRKQVIFDLALHAERRVFFERQRSEEHTSELQSRGHLVCRLLLEK